MSYPIVDLHCDLLLYLALDKKRTPFDPVARCSEPQLAAGNVKLQILAIAAFTDYCSVLFGQREAEIYQQLILEGVFKQFDGELTDITSVCAAIENASALFIEGEPLETGLERLEELLKHIPLFYLSLTWSGENRFGGGNGTQIGLKEDGKVLLEFLAGRGIAIDFSHTSDPLAEGILNHIDKKGLQLPVMASHSNFRAVHNHERNLPDSIAQEIIARNGIIGMVLYSKFLRDPQQVAEQIAHAYELGGEKAIAFGSDFFCFDDLRLFPTSLPEIGFFPEVSDASKFPALLEIIQKEISLTQEQLTALSSGNVLHFYHNFLAQNPAFLD